MILSVYPIPSINENKFKITLILGCFVLFVVGLYNDKVCFFDSMD